MGEEKQKKKPNIFLIVLVVAIVAVMAVLLILDIYRCPFKAITGIPCPGCGFTRACFSLCKGDIAGAFYYHPLWPVLLPTLIVEVIGEAGLIKLPRKANNIWLCIVGGLLIVTYIVRLATNTLV